jgi:hypothetical protein
MFHCLLLVTGGATIWVNDIHVDSATTYTIKVGAGGLGYSDAGGASSFSSAVWSVYANGGAPGAHHVGGQGGRFGVEGPGAGDLTKLGGGWGGRGGDASWKNETQLDVAGGGGGGGGYNGEWRVTRQCVILTMLSDGERAALSLTGAAVGSSQTASTGHSNHHYCLHRCSCWMP